MATTPNADQIQALKQFAAANGRNWKSELNNLWMNGAYRYAVMGGADAGLLQQVRNEFGPSWLVRFSLKAANLRDARAGRRDRTPRWDESACMGSMD